MIALLLRLFCICAISCLTTPSTFAQRFTTDQYIALDGLLGDNLDIFQNDADKWIDLLAGILDDSYKGSAYLNNVEAEGVRTRLKAEGAKLREEIIATIEEIRTERPKDSNPATMILLLSKEQTLSCKFYSWVRNVMEISALAYANSGRRDELAGKMISELIKAHENLQNIAGISIQGVVTAVLNKPTPEQ